MLKIENLYKSFQPVRGLGQELAYIFGRKSGGIKAVRGVDLQVSQGEILGLVGESGSGKSTLGRIIAGLYQPDKGRILYFGQDLAKCCRAELLDFRARVQIMFQDPASSLNPRMTAETALSEGLIIHKKGTPKERKEKINHLLKEVGLDPVLKSRYPHQFSGGQRQRLCLARALSLDPEFIIADEPASALDVSIQAQIINLILDLKASRGLTMLLISHDLALVRLMADRIAVMYGGRIMEIIPSKYFGHKEHHPYVRALWASALALDRRQSGLILDGEPPDPQNPPPGCPFQPRCPEAVELCLIEEPMLREIESGHFNACHLR